MGFKNNYSEASQGSGIKPEGDYECIITAVEERQTKNGAWGLNFTLVIRNDVPDQKYGNACLFHTIWKKKEPNDNDNAVKGYNFAQLMALGRAAKLPDGKDYDTLEQYCEDLVKKCIKATVKHEEYNGKTQECVSYVNETEYPKCKHKFKTSEASAPAASGRKKAEKPSPEPVYEDFDDADDDGIPF